MASLEGTRPSFGTTGFAGRIAFPFAALFGALSGWNDARVTRNALSRLSDRELEDIGLSRGDIDRVAGPHSK